MFRRMRQGWELTKKSWGVIREHPKLLRLPLVGGVLALIAVVVVGGPGMFLVASDSAETSDDLLVYLGYGLIALGSFIASCIVIYYNVILAAAADQALQGQEPDIAAARSIAGRRRGTIIGWAIVSAVVSVAFSIMRDKGGAIGNILGSIGAAAWGFVTFLVIPVIALEDIGPIDAVKRSGHLVKQRWGQQATGNVVIGGIATVVMFVGIVLGVIGGVLVVSGGVAATSGGVALLAVGIVIAVMAGLAAGATKGVFGVALYHFSAENRALGPFSESELSHAAG